MPRHLTCLFVLLALAGCASYTADYQERLVRSLPNQRDVTVSDTQTFPGKILCGRYTTLTGNGFSMRSGKFVVGQDMILSSPREDELLVYCSKNPVQQLYLRRGIGGPEADFANLSKVRNDMRAIDAAITRYYDTAATLPAALEVLLQGDFGVGKGQLTDPWGRAYFYEGGLSGRTAPQYQLVSFGADGEPGGRDADADISRDEIQMLDHVLKIAGK